MMPTYVYCFVAPGAPDPPPGATGLDDAPVRRLADAWVSDVTDRQIRPTLDRVRHHDAVVSLALDSGSTPLPARFGQTFLSDTQTVEVSRAKAPALHAALERVAGCVEMILLLRLPTVRHPLTTETETGTAYLRSLSERERTNRALKGQLTAAADRVTAAVAPFVRETSVSWHEEGYVSVAYLVDRRTLAPFHDHLNTGIETLGAELTAQTSGPSAPYTFGTLP